MPVASIARPINPPSASISRTRCPFAVPPIAGLHGMCATVSFVSVHSPTLTPSRAAAYAASHPACPAPITITSKLSAINSHKPLPQRTQKKYKEDAQEDVAQQVFRRALAGDFLQRDARLVQIGQHEFFGHRTAWRFHRFARARK